MAQRAGSAPWACSPCSARPRPTSGSCLSPTACPSPAVIGAVIGAAVALGGWLSVCLPALWRLPPRTLSTPFNLPWAGRGHRLCCSPWPPPSPPPSGRAARSARCRSSRRSRARSTRRNWSAGRCGRASSSSARGCSCCTSRRRGRACGGGRRLPHHRRAAVAARSRAPWSRPSSSTGSPGWPGGPRSLARLALRDLARYRVTVGAALAAVSFAVFIATVAITILASVQVRRRASTDYVAPNMAASQLILYNPGDDPSQYQPGQSAPAVKLAATRQQADALAAQLHAPAPVELELAVVANASQPAISTNGPPSGQAAQNLPGALVSLHGHGVRRYVLRGHAGAAQGVRHQPGRGQPGRGHAHSARAARRRRGRPLALVSGGFLAQSPPGCPAGMCIINPVIQEVTKLPSGTSVPNTVITEQAAKALHETVVPVGWLVQGAVRAAGAAADQRGPPGRASASAPASRPGPASSARATDQQRRHRRRPGCSALGVLGHDRRPDPQ